MPCPTTSTLLRLLAAVAALAFLPACTDAGEGAAAPGGETAARMTVDAENASSLAVERSLATTAAGFSLDWSADGSLLGVADHDLVRLVDGSSLRGRRGLHGDVSDVWAIRFSPSGRLLATASGDGATSVWNVRSGRRVRLLGRRATGAVLAVDWSPDGKRLASAGVDGVVRVWTLATGELSARYDYGRVVEAVAWSPGAAARLAVGGRGGAIALLDAARGEVVETLAGSAAEFESAGVGGLAWDAAGEFLAVALADGTVLVFRADPPTQLAELEGHDGRARGVAFSPDGNLLAAGGSDGAVLVWNAATWRPVADLSAHTNAVWSLAWAPDGTRLATAGSDERVRVWGVE